MLTLINPTGPVPPGRYYFFQAETRISTGPFSTLARLLNEVKRHRKSNNLPIGTDFEAEIQDWLCRRMPSAEAYCQERGDDGKVRPMKGSPYAGTGYDGREKWAEIHTYALVDRPTPQMRSVWLSEFADSLPCGDCKRGWKALVKANPLPLTASPEEFFRWTVARHNEVSAKLGYAEMGIDDALKIWSR
jgi:hypothetical protein